MSDQSAAVGGETLRFEQKAELRSFLLLSLKNGLLNIITLTLYRFWGKTEVRRRVWASTYMNGEAFEYTGRGVELFIGFVLAVLVIGLPFLLMIFGVQMLGPLVAPLLLLFVYIFVPVLVGFGIFSAARYMASRTTWRGVRFHLSGSAWSYGWLFLGQSLLTAITFGWFGPAMTRNMNRKIWSGLRFGDRKFSFDLDRAERVGVYGPFAIGVFGNLLVLGLMLAVLAATAAFPGLNGETTSTAPNLRQIATLYAVIFVFMPLLVLVWAPYRAAMLRSIAAGIGLDEARFSLNVKAMGLTGLIITNYLLLGVSLGLLAPFVQARTVKYMASRLTSTGEAQLSLAHQAVRGPKSGEGLADAFGFAPI